MFGRSACPSSEHELQVWAKYLCAHADWVEVISQFQQEKRQIIQLSRPILPVQDRRSKCCQGVRQLLFVQNQHRKLQTGGPYFVRSFSSSGSRTRRFGRHTVASRATSGCCVMRAYACVSLALSKVREAGRTFSNVWNHSLLLWCLWVKKAKHVRWFLADVPTQPRCWLEDPWKRKEMQPW